MEKLAEASTGLPTSELAPELHHLLQRCILGFSPRDATPFYGKSRTEVIQCLLQPKPIPDSLPLKDYDSIQAAQPDQEVGPGKPWVNHYSHDVLINEKRRYSLKNWIIGLLYHEAQPSLFPGMFLFWSNLFSLESGKIQLATRSFAHYDIIRNNALGNYKELLLAIIIDQALPYYYRKIMPPDQRLAAFTAGRILERFCLGADYEKLISREKIKKLIRLLNKWSHTQDSIVLHYKNLKPREIYNAENSHYQEAYYNKSSSREAIEEIDLLLQSILKQPAVAENLSTRLYHWIVGGPVTAIARQQLILPASNALLNSKYDIRTWLSSFLHSDFFAAPNHFNPRSSSPIDFVFGVAKLAKLIPVNAGQGLVNYQYWDWLRFQIELLGQSIADPPGPDGWPQYGPEGHQKADWLDQGRGQARIAFLDNLIEKGYEVKVKSNQLQSLQFLREFRSRKEALRLLHTLIRQTVSSGQQEIVSQRFIQSLFPGLTAEALASDDSGLTVSERKSLKEIIRFLLLDISYQFH